METQESSTVDRERIERETNFDSVVDSPIVTLTTPYPQASGSVRGTVNSLRKIQEQEQELKKQQRRIQELEFSIAIHDAHTQNIKDCERIPLTPSLPPVPTVETPGPHRLHLKPERSEDVAYRAKMAEQKNAEAVMDQQGSPPDTPEKEMMNIFQALTKVLKDNNQHLQSSDVTDPTKFNGLDTQWDDFYLQFRTFLEAKGWLTTFDHATGPGTPGFDNEINKKIYNKLLSLCRKGTAATYVTKAAASNEWEAGKYLLDRYEGFSKQREKSLKSLIETIRHTNGTNMTRHIDKF